MRSLCDYYKHNKENLGTSLKTFSPYCLRDVLQFAAMRRMYFIIIIGLLFGSLSRVQAQAGDLLSRVNGLRASLGLPAYSLNGTLSAAAQSQAQWMVETGNISHSRPDGSTPRSRAQAAGYSSTFVSENIYGGTNATVDTAWNFWINSAIHYAGLTNPNYEEIGIGAASGAWGSTYVLVFGNPGGPPPLPPQAARVGGQAGVPQAPSFVVGWDANGNIMHEVQSGDTLGDIALIYGYTWDDIPYMMQINGLTNPRDLDIGSILLVPPYGGTYTPTPVEATPAPTVESTAALVTDESISTPIAEASATPVLPSATATISASATPDIALVASAPTPEITPIGIAAAGGTITQSGPSPWLAVAVVVQAVVLVGAALEYALRGRRRRR